MFCVSFVICFIYFTSLTHAIPAKTELPPAIFPTDNSTYKIIAKNESLLQVDTAPLIFPKNNSHFKFEMNKTALQVLNANTNSELDDLNTTNTTSTQIKLPETELVSGKGPDLNAELVEPDPDPGIDVLTRDDASFLEEKWPALLAGVFAIIAVLCYLGLLVWRRLLEHRYGTNEMLINEEDITNYNTDTRNFEL